MKKSVSALGFVAAIAAAAPAVAATNYAVRTGPANVNYQKYETRSTTRTYSNNSNNARPMSGAYYQPSTNRAQMYRSYTNNSSTTTTTNRTTTTRSSMKRKYYLAHPFFQPTEGMFGSITDLSYNTASYDVKLDSSYWSDPAAEWKMSQFAIKEDLSYGITDHLAILLMGRYDFTKYKFDWSLAATPDDNLDDDGLNIFGGGLQWRFTDNEKWIGTISGYYERQRNISNDFVLDVKAGYKISKSTVYGLVRGWLLNFDDEMYGNGITGVNAGGTPGSFFIVYDADAKTTFFVEGGIGVFSVLSEDWTLNIEAILGHYDWHNQASIKAAIGWQPNDWFALNLYAKTSFYDTAEDKTLQVLGTNSAGAWVAAGNADLDKYQEMSFGGQVIFYF